MYVWYAFLNMNRLIVSTSSLYLTFDNWIALKVWIGTKHLSDKEEMPFECFVVSSYKEVNVLWYWLTTLRKKSCPKR